MTNTCAPTSTYASSVKFYERIYELHGQLKHQDEEQYNLQAELHRLMPQYPPASSSSKFVHGLNNGTSQDSNGPSNVTPTSLLANSPRLPSMDHDQNRFSGATDLKSCKLVGDEQRRQRNDLILKKLKELESTASVFAARSEKLRIMRSEMDTVLNRYMSKRATSIGRLNQLSSSVPNLVTVQGTNPLSVSIGVNTDITGPIMPLEKPSEFSWAPTQLSPSAFTIPTMAPIEPPHIPVLAPLTFSSMFQATHPRPDAQATFSDGLQSSQSSSAAIHVPPMDTIAIDKYSAVIRASQELLQGQQTLGASKKAPVLPSTSLEDDSKIRHNVYFDLSTTSESELTSRRVDKEQKKRVVNIPINLSFDDTTTLSDTVSLSVQESKRQQKRRSSLEDRLKMNLSRDISSDFSDSIASKARGRSAGNEKPKEPQHLVEDLEQKENAATTGPSGTTNLEDLNEPEEESNRDAVSESMETSVGDSVMDSVQKGIGNETAAEGTILSQEPSRRESMESIENLMQKNVNETIEVEKPLVAEVVQKDPVVEPVPEKTKVTPEVVEATKPVVDKPAEPKSTLSAGKRLKIKMDYDTDSDASEPVNLKPAAQPSSQDGLQVDDDFDDFFDI